MMNKTCLIFVACTLSMYDSLAFTSNNFYGWKNVNSLKRVVKKNDVFSNRRSFLELSMGSKVVTSVLKKVGGVPATAIVGALGAYTVVKILDKPSRKYIEGSVAKEYDAWTEDGVLEYYWGEHIHLGYYTADEMSKGYRKKGFIDAKYDFIDEMMKLGDISTSGKNDVKVLDVGCGVGGTSRYVAKNLGEKCHVTGITLSPNQVKRATELAQEQEIKNVDFLVMDALNMTYLDNSFDIVWACESGEHMPNKELYINEMMRVLKPGGKFVMATWCQRDDTMIPFSKKEKRDLNFLYEEWTHPYFISIDKYRNIIDETNMMEKVKTQDWKNETIASWRHSIWVGIEDPKGWILKPRTYVKCVRDAYCLERMHRAFDRGLMEYGMFAATKKESKPSELSDAKESVTI